MSQRRTNNNAQDSWADPYALDTTEEEADDIVSSSSNAYFRDAHARPMGSLYAATQPGAQRVIRPANAHPQEQLMYQPRQLSSSPPVQQQQQQQPQQQSQYSPYSLQQMPSEQRARSPIPPTQQQHYHHQSPATVAGYPGTYNEDGIGVGVMVDSRGSGSGEHFEEEARYQQQTGHAAGMAEQQHQYHPSVPYGVPPPQQHIPAPPVNPMPIPTLRQNVRPVLPNCKPMEPVTPTPRRSRRYLETTNRVPDISQGILSSTSSSSRLKNNVMKNHALVMCTSCHAACQVPKQSVLLKCPKCRSVSSATPMRVKSMPLMH